MPDIGHSSAINRAQLVSALASESMLSCGELCLMAYAYRISSQKTLSYTEVSQFMGSLNLASGLILLGRLHLRPLQRHFHSLGLTNWFSPSWHSDPLVLATLLEQWQDLSFLTSGIPIRPFQPEFTISRMVIFFPSITGLQGHHVLIAKDNTTVVAYMNQQTGWDPFPPPVAAGNRSVSVATDSGHNSKSQTRSRLPKCDSRPPVSAEPRSRVSDIQALGNSSSGQVCHSPQQASSPVHVSSSGASSTGDRCLITGLAGEVDVHVSTVFPAQQSHSEAQDYPDEQGDTHRPLLAVTTVVSTPATTECGSPTILSVPQRPVVTKGRYLQRQVIPSARMEALMQHYQAAGFSKKVCRLAAAPRRPSTNIMYDDRWLRLR